MSFDPPSVSRRDALRITAAVGIAAVAGGHTAMEIIRRAGLHRVSVSKARLGTLVEIDVVHPDRDGAHEMIRGAFAEIDRLESILSRHRTDSALSILNRAGEVMTPSHDLVTVLESALHIARMTDGAFDPTVLPLLEVHASSFSVSGRPPEPDVLRRTVQRVGHQNVVVSEERVALMRPDMGVTLDGIGKGYVVDRTVQALVRAGAERVLVDAGGDIASGGERSKE
ncbi:MAG: FAD:protein FMN transferase, partial [Gemmatimonadales bacterium]|nr:FAD:protein FMN transferase [Gemmatimonadales bacterium]